MQAKESRRNIGFIPRYPQKKKTQAEKQNMICNECGKTRHLNNTCFEIHGYPEWYKALVEKKKGQTDNSQALNTAKVEKYVAAAVGDSINKKMISELMQGLIY
ncbi:UNVERIFIED_CONTAM: hypothetical protein Sindi_0381500 [Sesamum indicum]